MKFVFHSQSLDPDYETDVLVEFNPRTDVVTLTRLDTQEEIKETDLSIEDLENYRYEYERCLYHKDSEIREEIRASQDEQKFEEFKDEYD